MVGNRVDKTMRKAKLKSFIGEKWFFPTVNEAVQYCIRHQHLKRLKAQQPSSVEDLPLITAEIALVLKRSRVAIVQCQIEPSSQGGGSKHMYLLRNLKATGKLSEAEIDLLKAELAGLLQEASAGAAAADGRVSTVSLAASPPTLMSCPADSGKVATLEEALVMQQKSQMLMQKQLEEQSRRIDQLLRIGEAANTTKINL